MYEDALNAPTNAVHRFSIYMVFHQTASTLLQLILRFVSIFRDNFHK